MTPKKRAPVKRAPTVVRKNAGAPSKRTPQARARILRALLLGQSYDSAALVGGMSHDTLGDWRKDDPEFGDACLRARAEMEYAMLERIELAATDPKLWTAAAWKLERIFPDRYGKQTITLQGNPDQPISITMSLAQAELEVAQKLAGMSIDELRAFRSLRARRDLRAVPDVDAKDAP